MRLEDKQEQLGLAVLHATCAKAGFGFKICGRIQDNWGWDAEADVHEKLDADSVLYDFKIKFQAKATGQQLTLGLGRYSFTLKAAHDNRLRATGGSDAADVLGRASSAGRQVPVVRGDSRTAGFATMSAMGNPAECSGDRPTDDNDILTRA